ncbi:glycosomal membrane protein-like protein [Leptomonas seymouri]|uniref:Glycosomal membrane protein-like protein n=1 Tax=Leptomonas seymouri TaxID=5684 RepID=A0A0N1IJG1_LEPSE|nr:glycosomal membrane protein-like protein [Leptomonas seymouri]|eukprot:KPI85113.1 glycosomal membrane protein-like protein [Leptomonas seymouri]
MSNALLGASRVLATTDGADKLVKFIMGLLTVHSTRDIPKKIQFAEAAQNLAKVRSALRIGHVFGIILKLLSLRDLFAAQGFKYTENKKFVEFFKVIFDMLYAMGDHMVLLAREGLIATSLDVARLVHTTRVAQVVCHILGVILNLFDLRDAARRLVYDPPAAKRACQIAAIGTLRDFADALVAMSLLGHVRNGRTLSIRSEGALTCFSGLLSTYLCWKYN